MPGRIANAIYLMRVREYGVREFLKADDTIITVKRDEHTHDEDLMFATLDDDQLRALQTAITSHGVKPPEASFVQGKLEATTEHLADMRKLVFEPGVIKVIQKGKVE